MAVRIYGSNARLSRLMYSYIRLGLAEFCPVVESVPSSLFDFVVVEIENV